MWMLDSTSNGLRHLIDTVETRPDGKLLQHRYGILSHRWEDNGQELTFEEVRHGFPISNKLGATKIQKCQQIAQDVHGLDLLWADTCCIDKRSSAELEETINSMYRYYQQANICFAYLRDVTKDDLPRQFTKSEWFKRGWTLQELLAPPEVHFYDRDWSFMGTKADLSQLIQEASGIPKEVLLGEQSVRDYSVAQRMSWAAGRTTTRIEDRAYSLLGLFDVNMPMLYGEGMKTFFRLQAEIFKTLDDHSIFAWEGITQGIPSMLAPSPEAFASCGNVKNLRLRKGRQPYTVNNRELYGLVSLFPHTLDTYLTPLQCTMIDGPGDRQVGIFLRRLWKDNEYMRVAVNGQDIMHDATSWINRKDGPRNCIEREISIRQTALSPDEIEGAYRERIQGFRINESILTESDTQTPRYSIQGTWDSTTRVVSILPGSGRLHCVGSINIGAQGKEIEVIRFGFDHEFNPLVYLTTKSVTYSEIDDVSRDVYVEEYRNASVRQSFESGSPVGVGRRSIITQLSNGTRYAEMSKLVDGFWPLEGDRIDGLDVYVTGSALKPQPHSTFKVCRVRLSRAVVEDKCVWDLTVDELSPSRRQSRRSELHSLPKKRSRESKTILRPRKRR